MLPVVYKLEDVSKASLVRYGDQQGKQLFSLCSLGTLLTIPKYKKECQKFMKI